jgi:phosphatidylglycerophosphate synthase
MTISKVEFARCRSSDAIRYIVRLVKIASLGVAGQPSPALTGQRGASPAETVPCQHRAELLLAAFTIVRLCFIPIVVATFMLEPAVTAGALAAFMIADLYDGVLARRYKVDGPVRRALDSTVDRIAIDVCLIAAYVAGALPWFLLAGFLLRDLYCGIVCSRMLYRRHVAIKTDLVYRGLSFSIATWGTAAPFLSATNRNFLAGMLLMAAAAVAVDLTRSVRLLLAVDEDEAGSVIPAADLRRRHRSHSQGTVPDPTVDERRLLESRIELHTI